MSVFRKIITSFTYPFALFYYRLFPGIRVLMYHRVTNSDKYDQLAVSPERFEKQMRYLSNYHRIISFSQAVKELKIGSRKSGVVISFDDGYLDNLLNALPILEKYNIPAIIFITTDFCNQKIVHSRYSNKRERIHLNWEDVNKLFSSKNITIGSHTVSHPFLSRINIKQSYEEITKSKKIIEKKLNTIIKYFCYPSGDYSNVELEYVKNAGYEAAVTVAPGNNHFWFNPYAIKRTEINNKDGVNEIRYKLAGAFDLIHIILHWKRCLQFKKLSR